MNRLSVTIVDIMGFLVPGVVLLFGLILLPLPPLWLQPLNDELLARLPILTNPWVNGACWLLAAYVLGFLLRLTSISLLNRLTFRRWIARLEREAKTLEPLFRTALGNAKLAQALEELAQQYGKRDAGKYAPHFHFAKRLVRTNPELWVEAERLEAEVRFSAGLFVPFVVLAVDGIVRAALACGQSPGAWLLLAGGVTGAVVIVWTFPSRRVKEVLYVQFLALVLLRQSGGQTDPPAPREGDNQPPPRNTKHDDKSEG